MLRSAIVDNAQSSQLPLQVHLEAGVDPQEQHLAAEGVKKNPNIKQEVRQEVKVASADNRLVLTCVCSSGRSSWMASCILVICLQTNLKQPDGIGAFTSY